MTRAAHRILNRARADAWRRVGIPERWETPRPEPAPGKTAPATDADTERADDSHSPANQNVTPYMRKSRSDETTGKNVTGPTGNDAGTGRSQDASNGASSRENER